MLWEGYSCASQTVSELSAIGAPTRPLWAATVIFMMVAIGFAAAAFGGWFRRYAIVSAVILVACGMATFGDAPRVQANLPTPWVGVWERINIGVFLAWVVVFALLLLRSKPWMSRQSSAGRRKR